MSNKIKILFLGNPKSPNTISWIEGLRKLDCEVEIGTVRPDEKYPAHLIGNPKFPPRLRILTGLNSLKELITKLQPDLILAYRVTSYGYLAARSGFHPIVIAAQNEQITYMDHPSYWRKKALNHFAKFAVKKGDLFHAWSNNIRKGLLTFGTDDEKILVLHRGINMEIFHPNKEFKPINAKNPVFISTRSLTHEYLIDKLIRAFLILLRDLPDAKLRIIGDGDDRPNLEALVQDLKLSEKVDFSGRITSEKCGEELRHADVYISLIDTEGLSSSLIEACATGIVPVVAEMPASRELVEDGKTGFLINDFSPLKIAEMMKTASLDPSVQKNCFQNTKSVHNRFDRQKNLKTFVENYQQLLKS